MLDCGHPEECLVPDEDDEYCAWCAEVARLQSHYDTLREQIEKTAVIIHGGSGAVSLSVQEPIGYMAIYSGTVNVGPALAPAVALEKTGDETPQNT